jgi:hypothetical protein
MARAPLGSQDEQRHTVRPAGNCENDVLKLFEFGERGVRLDRRNRHSRVALHRFSPTFDRRRA